MVVLGHPALAARCRRSGAATVFIPVATPGIGSAGHLFRTDGTVLMPLDAVHRRSACRRWPRCARPSSVAARHCVATREGARMSSLLLRGGRVVDPVHTTARAAARPGACATAASSRPSGGEVFDQEIDASGCVVMAGGIDLHTHIGGGKVNLARLLMAEDHRDGADPIALPANPLELASCGSCTPGTLATGYRYVEMGYTAAFEPAMVPSNARHAHMEMGDVPILDHGAYVMLGNDELFLQLLAEGGPDARNFAQIRDYTAWTMHASKAMGVKVVNPGGISAFKFNQRKLDVDEPHVHWQVTPRQVVHTLARALRELGVPHPLHIHGSNLGVAGNIALDAGDHRRARGPAGAPDARAVPRLRQRGAEEVLVGRAAAGRGGEREPADQHRRRPDHVRPDRHRLGRHHAPVRATRISASPRKWVGADIEGMAGCGVVPFRYREQSYVNALQWAIGLEIFLLVHEPLAGGADHRPPERRPVHQLPAPDPAADGPQLPRGAAGASCIPRWRRTARCARSRAS